MTPTLPPANDRALILGTYPNSSMALRTRFLVASEMGLLPLITYDTVA